MESIFKSDLYQYLLGRHQIDERLPEAPDIEGKWYDIANTYMPDAIREFNQYPTVVLGWMMYVGMAMAKYWDDDWQLYSKVDNLYTYLRNRIDFDHMDDYIRKKVLLLNAQQSEELQALVAECGARTNNILCHLSITPGSKDAYKAVIAALHQLYLFGIAIELKRLGYHMTKIG